MEATPRRPAPTAAELEPATNAMAAAGPQRMANATTSGNVWPSPDATVNVRRASTIQSTMGTTEKHVKVRGGS